jgi:ATP-dependent Clp protease ATP-binding subunit ClpB
MANAKFTQKVESYLSTAAELAQESSHQQLSPVHLAIAMFEDPEGIGKQCAVKAGGKKAWSAPAPTQRLQ